MIALPEIKTNRIAIKLSSASERMVKKNHPWVFEKGIVKESPGAKAGDLVIIFDERKNKFLALGLYDPYSPIRIKVLQFHVKGEIGDAWFRDKIQGAFEKRKPLLETDTNSYRLIFGENDFFPGLIADVYADVLVVKLYSHIWLPYLKDIIPFLVEVSEVSTCVLRLSRNLMQQGDTFGLEDGQVILGTLENPNVGFVEHGIKFNANVIKGHKTGFFLDHRENRRMIGNMAAGKKVLDVFSYAGGFSVHALVGGATSVLSVDISKKALSLASANVKLNADQISGKHKTWAMDAFDALQELINKREQFDLVIIDPPSFAKSAKEILPAKVSYNRLAKLGVSLTKQGGTLLLASCSSRIKADEFFEINEGAIDALGSGLKLYKKTFHDIDHQPNFEEGKYLKAGYYK